jgi:2-polyprenyl-3-methyl-5-hydroxy-6-metoxy-1,4-benzoquinol methylase
VNRILEPQFMIGKEQCKQFQLAPREILRKGFMNWVSTRIHMKGSVVDIGCGPADYLISLYKEYPNITITGVDKSLEMRKLATEAVYSMNDRITILENTDDKYDVVISTNSLHHFHNPFEFWQMVVDLGNLNAQIFVMDLIRPKSEDQITTILETFAEGTNILYYNDFKNSLKAAFTKEELIDQISFLQLDLQLEIIGNTCEIAIIHGKLS